MIGGRKVVSNEKTLSLYESDPHVIVLGKGNVKCQIGYTQESLQKIFSERALTLIDRLSALFLR